MKGKEVSILSTRPLDVSLIEAAAFQNVKIDIQSFITIKKIVLEEVEKQVNRISQEKATVVLTSLNAVEIVVDMIPEKLLMPDWKIYCLGGATFTLVKKYWPFTNIAYTAVSATELAGKIIANKEDSVIFFCGNKKRDELPVLLSEQKIKVEECVVYETIETPFTIVHPYDGILFFSPSGVTSFFSENLPSSQTIFFAIGSTTANTIKQFSANRIIISDFPAKDQLVETAIRYFSERAMEK